MTLLRKPALYWFVLAAAAAFGAGSRLSLRLLFDTAIVFLPVVVVQVIAFTLVYWTGRRAQRFGPALDGFFDGSAPWFVAMTVLGGFSAAATAIESARWFAPVSAVAMVGAVVATLPLDFRFYRGVLGRTSGRAAADVIVQRLLAWPPTVLYFLVTASPKAGTLVSTIHERLFS